MSKPAFASTKPLKPPTVNKNIKPQAKSIGVEKRRTPYHIVANQLKTLTAVGIAIIIVADVK